MEYSNVDFTCASYNMGGLSEHYDYLHSASMEQLMQERYQAEPANMATVEKIQSIAARRFLSVTDREKQAAEQEWEKGGFEQLSQKLTAPPTVSDSVNSLWYAKDQAMISDYKTRPAEIKDPKVAKVLREDLGGTSEETILHARQDMFAKIFHRHLMQDILCLQETEYLDANMLPSHLELLKNSRKNPDAIAWNKSRFVLVEVIGSLAQDRAFAVKLKDKATEKTILVASGHLTGCDPFKVQEMANGKLDSTKGDEELKTIIGKLKECDADYRIIGMDANVTALHPRLRALKENGYRLDVENFMEPTCSNPYVVLNTRLDWLAVEGKDVSITNIPLLSVGLNNHLTNPSDHKPIAAEISYFVRQKSEDQAAC